MPESSKENGFVKKTTDTNQIKKDIIFFNK